MEATAKENFYQKIGIRCHSVKVHTYTFSLYLIIRKYSTEKTKFSLPKKKKSRKPHAEIFGKVLFVYDGNGCHSLGLQRLVGPVGRHACDAIEHVEAVGHFTESRVGAVQMGCILVHDEELGACGVGTHGSRHGENALGVS